MSNQSRRRVIYPHQFFDRNNDNTPEPNVSEHSHHIEFNDLTPEDEASKVLIPSREPGFIFTTPKPGKEGIGIQIHDEQLGAYTLLLSLPQVRYLMQQLATGLDNLDAARLECQLRGDRSQQ